MEEAVWNLENGKEYVGERDEGVLGEGYYSTMWQVLVSAGGARFIYSLLLGSGMLPSQ